MAQKTSKKPKIGDVIRIKTAKGYAYAQLTHENKLLGFMIRVFPGIHKEPVEDVCELVKQEELYSTFIHRLDFYEEPHIVIVTNCPLTPRSRLFPMFRDGIKNPNTGRVEKWWLWNGENSAPVGPLTEEMKTMPIREFNNYKTLIKKIESGWLPSDEQ
jgi:hypothetical protein